MLRVLRTRFIWSYLQTLLGNRFSTLILFILKADSIPIYRPPFMISKTSFYSLFMRHKTHNNLIHNRRSPLFL